MQATGIIHHVCIMSYKMYFVNFGEAGASGDCGTLIERPGGERKRYHRSDPNYILPRHTVR